MYSRFFSRISAISFLSPEISSSLSCNLPFCFLHYCNKLFYIHVCLSETKPPHFLTRFGSLLRFMGSSLNASLEKTDLPESDNHQD